MMKRDAVIFLMKLGLLAVTFCSTTYSPNFLSCR